MLRGKNCRSCRYYLAKMFQDMGASCDGCSFYEKYFHLEWHLCLFDDGDSDFCCPFYKKKQSSSYNDFASGIAEFLVKTYSDLFSELMSRMIDEILEDVDDVVDDEEDDD